jgi:uncharacterized membrane protein (UPF0136 family)
MGYFKKGSTISLVAGLTFGGLLVGSGILISQGESYKGHALASGVTGAMTLAMGQRFVSTGKFMPAGMVASLGAIGLAYNVKKAVEWMPMKEGEQPSRVLLTFERVELKWSFVTRLSHQISCYCMLSLLRLPTYLLPTLE